MRKQGNKQKPNNVIAFPSKDNLKTVSIILPPKVAPDSLASYTADDNSLAAYGIFDADILIISEEADWNQIDGLQLCVVRIGGRRCARVCIKSAEYVHTVKDFGAFDSYKREDVELIGMVVSFQRNFRINRTEAAE